MRMVRRYLLFAVFFTLFAQIVPAQESLGDIARKLKAQKGATENTAPAAPVPSTPAPANGSTGGQQQSNWSIVSAGSTAQPAIVADLNADTATDINGLMKYDTAIYQLFLQDKFEEIDRRAHEARVTQARFSGGFFKLHETYLAVISPNMGLKATDAEWQQHLAGLKRWIQQRPDSITARVALAWFYHNYGWAARGGGYADSVTDEGWRLMAERAGMGRKILEEAQALPEKCPEWFSAMMAIAGDESWDSEQSLALFKKAIEFNPDYYYFYLDQAEMLLPKWGGNEGDVAAFADAMTNRLGGKKGDAMYFLIGTTIVCNCANHDHLNGLSWERLKRGYAASEELYGRSIKRLNKMAYMASQADDSDYANTLFTQIGENWDPQPWRAREYFDEARRKAGGTIMQRNYKEAMANSTSPEGSVFVSTLNETINRKYHDKLMDCMKTVPDYNLAQVGMLMRLGKDGKPQQILFSPHNVPAGCFQPEVEKAVFSAPPHADYWVVVLMDVKK